MRGRALSLVPLIKEEQVEFCLALLQLFYE